MASLENVPAELRAEARWVCWRREERGGKATKLPVCAANGRMAKSTDPATWATFEDAVAAVGRWRCDGVGFVFGPDRAFTGLDLDHVIVDGVLDAEYRWVVEEAGTYTEVSPSGDGLHLIFRGAKPDWATRSRRSQPGGRVVEMYDHDRYFTVTGAVFEGHDAISENPAVVERAYRTWIEPEAAAQPALSAAGTSSSDGMDDDALLERMCASRSGDAIRALMAGDCSAQGGDRSAADMALCSHLAFWCAGDADRMDRIFRRSGLMRDKWDSRRGGSTYGAQTIERAEARPMGRRPSSARSRGARSSTSRGSGRAAPPVPLAQKIRTDVRSAARAGHTGVLTRRPPRLGRPTSRARPPWRAGRSTGAGGSGRATAPASRCAR